MQKHVWKKDTRYGNDTSGTYWFGETSYMVSGEGKKWYAYKGYFKELISVETTRENAGYAIEAEMAKERKETILEGFSFLDGNKLELLEIALKEVELTEHGTKVYGDSRRELLAALREVA